MPGNDVVTYMLKGMPLSEFIALFIIAMGGAFSFFGIKLLIAFLTPAGQPVPKWNWRKFWVGIGRLIVTAITIPWWILYFEDLMPIFLNIFMDFPEIEEGSVKNILVEMNQASAVLSGFVFDLIVRKAAKKFKK